MRCHCFSRLNTCCAHKKHWMCGYVKQVSWFITVICHLLWMVLISSRTNSSSITTSSTAIAVAVFLSLFFFFHLVSGDTNCQLIGQNPQVTWFILTCSGWKYGPAWEELGDFPPKLANKIFQAVSGPSRRLLQHLCRHVGCGVRSSFFLGIVNKIFILASQEQYKTFCPGACAIKQGLEVSPLWIQIFSFGFCTLTYFGSSLRLNFKLAPVL